MPFSSLERQLIPESNKSWNQLAESHELNENTYLPLTFLIKRYQTITAICRIIKGFAFYSSKRPILRVIGGAEGVVPHPHNGGSK